MHALGLLKMTDLHWASQQSSQSKSMAQVPPRNQGPEACLNPQQPHPPHKVPKKLIPRVVEKFILEDSFCGCSVTPPIPAGPSQEGPSAESPGSVEVVRPWVPESHMASRCHQTLGLYEHLQIPRLRFFLVTRAS